MGSNEDDEFLLARLNALKTSTGRTPASVARRSGANTGNGDEAGPSGGDGDDNDNDDDLARRLLGLRSKYSANTGEGTSDTERAKPEIDEVESLEDMLKELRASQKSALAPGDGERAKILIAQVNATLGEGDKNETKEDSGKIGGEETGEEGVRDDSVGDKKERKGSNSSSNKGEDDVYDRLARLKGDFAKYSKRHGDDHDQDSGKEVDDEERSEGDDDEADAILAELLDDVHLENSKEQEEHEEPPGTGNATGAVSETQAHSEDHPSRINDEPNRGLESSELDDLVLPSVPTISHAALENDELDLPTVPTGNFTKPAPKSSLRKYTDDEIETWCEICLANAQVKCLGCDGDLYCLRCWKEGHTGPDAGFEERMHKCVQYARAGGLKPTAA